MKIKDKINWLLPLSLLLLAVLTRFCLIDRIPANLNPDEGDTLRTFLEHAYGKNRPWLLPNWNGSSSLNMLSIGYIWQLTGLSYAGVRTTMALTSILALALFYWLVLKQTEKSWLAFLTTLLLLGDSWFLNFSRSAWENLLVAIPVLLLLISEHTSLKWKRILLMTVAVSSMYGYHPAKFVALLAGLELLLSFLKEKKFELKEFMLLSLIGCLAVPIIYATFFQFRQESFHRIVNVSVFTYPNAIEEIWSNAQKTVVAFSVWSRSAFNYGLHDRYLPSGRFVLAPWLVFFYGLGIGWLLLKKRKILGWYILLLLPTQIFSLGTPDAARAAHLVPFVYYLIVLGMDWLMNWVKSGRWRRRLIYFLLTAAASATSIASTNRYFSWMQQRQTLEHRQPYVRVDEYQEWLKAEKESIVQNGISISLGEWRALKDR